VNVGTMTWTSALGQIRAGKLVPIALSAQARLKEFPDLPTFREEGYEELTAVSWFALSGPAGLAGDITLKLNRMVAAMLEHPEVRRRFERDAVETQTMSSAEFTAFVKREIEKWAPVAKQVMKAN
jgi:tripartite-type tricarboxylate transporter receptor subunit TctC